VEVVRGAIEAWQRYDATGAIAFWDQDIELVSPPDDPDQVVVKGVTAATAALGRWLSTWDTFHYELTELKDLGDHVLQGGRQVMQTRGAEVASEVYYVWTFRDKRAIRMRMFYDRASALKAVGLEA
jgi:ketosteroid isomerase-like protein